MTTPEFYSVVKGIQQTSLPMLLTLDAPESS